MIRIPLECNYGTIVAAYMAFDVAEFYLTILYFRGDTRELCAERSHGDPIEWLVDEVSLSRQQAHGIISDAMGFSRQLEEIALRFRAVN